MDFAKQVNTYSEYALYAMALQTTDPRKKVDLIEDLLASAIRRASTGPGAARGSLQAYRQTGDTDKAIALAEKILARIKPTKTCCSSWPTSYLQKGKDPDKGRRLFREDDRRS